MSAKRSNKTNKVEVTHIVLPSHANAVGTMFGGQLMSWVDLAAAIAASRHSHRIAVTASMDQLDFIHPIRVGDYVVLKSSVNFTGRTSMEVGVRAEVENPLTGERVYAASAYLTFVAIDELGKPTQVPQFIPENPEEERRNKAAQLRRQQRIELKKQQQP